MTKIFTQRCNLADVTPYDKENVIKIFMNSKTRQFLGGSISFKEAEQKFNNFNAIHSIFCH